MVEAVTRAKALGHLARELGFANLSNVIHLGTDSSAAKSFVNRRGLGKMRHIEVRDLWLQKEVREGRVEVYKIPGIENPADLMTKVLGISDIIDRLKGMTLEYVKRNIIADTVNVVRKINDVDRRIGNKANINVYIGWVSVADSHQGFA